ncbi:MAG: efflux RND transporter permease subunit [Pseudomonadales bacterium]
MDKLIAWFVHNPIAANILMVLIAVGGITTLPGIDKEFFPQRKVDTVFVSVAYPGAGPAEVEQQIAIRIEEALDSVDGIERLTSTSVEGFGTVLAEVASGFETLSVLNEIKSQVDSINTFPVESEQPQVAQQLWKSYAIRITIAGDISERNLKELGLQAKDELSVLPDVRIIEPSGIRNYELAIELSEQQMRRYGLTFDDVARAVRGQSLNLPAGKIRSSDGDLQLQTRNQAYERSDFEQISVIKREDGTRVRLGEVATVKDGFEETDVGRRFNGMRAITLDVYMSNNPNIGRTSDAVNTYVDDLRKRLPPGVVVAAWQDMNDGFEGRVRTLLSNGIGGLVLVFALLLLFLRPMLALWVSVGIGVAFLGAFWWLPATGTSLNIVSLFAFILILGIVVDDAIIVAESVYGQQASGKSGIDGAIIGTQLVLKPVFFAVLTTMVVFGTFYLLPAEHTEAMHIAAVVLLALIFSLVECLLILPSHLAHMRPEVPSTLPGLKQLDEWRARLNSGLLSFTENRYKPLLEACLRSRWLTLSVFVVVLFISGAMYSGGWVLRSFAPIVQSDFLVANIEAYEGTAFQEMDKVMTQIESAAYSVKEEINSNDHEYIGHVEAAIWGGNNVYVAIELSDFDNLPYTNEALVEKWRNSIGELPGIKEYSLRSVIIDNGKDLQFEISAPTLASLKAGSQKIVSALNRFSDISNVRSSLDNPRPEIALTLKPEADTLNLTQAELASQVRRAFYGEEVQRIPRLREDVKVMVRYPLAQRESLDSMLNMKIRTQTGEELPFEAIANFEYQDSYTKIERIDRRRSALVTADLAEGAQAFQLIAELFEKDFANIQKELPELLIKLEGEQEDAREFEAAIQSLIIATMIIVFGIMAVVFHSYWQPLLIVTAIPFGLVGAIIGHIIIGREISMFSLLGILACAGVVVNDNLVLVDRVNRYREEGKQVWDAIVSGATDRFRAIILTSLTTFVGLLPIMLERSVQAQFLIPMVASLAFGVLFATFVTLLFTPALYLAGESLRDRLRNLIGAKQST